MAADEEKPIRIVDRRMFTPDGDPRPGFQPDETPEAPARTSEAAPAPPPPPPPRAPAPATPAEREETAAGEEPPAESREPGSDFASLVRSLATPAYSALGLGPHLSGSPVPAVG